MDHMTAAIIIGGFVVLELLKKTVSYFWKKFIKTVDNEQKFITETRCNSCRTEQDKSDREFKREMRENMGQIKGILLVLATEGKVDIEQLSKLITRS